MPVVSVRGANWFCISSPFPGGLDDTPRVPRISWMPERTSSETERKPKPFIRAKESMHRLFVAIRLPENIVDLMVDVMDDSPSLRWVPADNLHLTLRFIGEVERPLAEEIAQALGRIRAERFSVRLSGIGCFEQRNGGAVWAGVEPRAPVAALAAKVEIACQSAGCEPERRAFHPHLTLARFGHGSKANV